MSDDNGSYTEDERNKTLTKLNSSEGKGKRDAENALILAEQKLNAAKCTEEWWAKKWDKTDIKEINRVWLGEVLDATSNSNVFAEAQRETAFKYLSPKIKINLTVLRSMFENYLRSLTDVVLEDTPATLSNVVTAIENENGGGAVGYDLFTDELMLKKHNNEWETFTDEHYTFMRLQLAEAGMREVPRETTRDAVYYVAKNNKFDSAILWLESLVWDKVPRVSKFNHNYLNTEDTQYTTAVSNYMWTALAGRIMVAGIQADMVPIWIGKQGVKKSSAVKALVPNEQFYCEISFNETEDNLARKMRGRLVAEIGELRGLHTKDKESIKSFITRRVENWTPKYKEFTTSLNRRMIMVGTSNIKEFLDDETGNRRWLPMEVGYIKLDKLIKHREQLWAEAAVMFKENGVMWEEAEKLVESEHEKYQIADVWVDELDAWIRAYQISAKKEAFFTTEMALRLCFGFTKKDIEFRHQARLSKALKQLGFRKERNQKIADRPYIWGKGDILALTELSNW